VRSKTETRKVVSKTDPPVKSPPKAAPKKAKSPVLSSEGDEWADYLDDLASQQGKCFETGFVGIDEEAGGLSTGLLVLVDEEQERCIGFLKQLTDQIAIKTKVPCLFLSFETKKPILRIWTLSRLSGVPAKDIERGRLKKDSQDWEAVDRNGRNAASWLKRVFVVEGAASTNLDQLRELGRQLVGSAEDATGVVVVDSLEKLESELSIQAKLAELKAMAESLDVLLVAASNNQKTLSAPDVNFAAELGDSDGEGVRLRILRAGEASTSVRLMYRPTIHKFVEQ
jgi:replicative DNA helicase